MVFLMKSRPYPFPYIYQPLNSTDRATPEEHSDIQNVHPSKLNSVLNFATSVVSSVKNCFKNNKMQFLTYTILCLGIVWCFINFQQTTACIARWPQGILNSGDNIALIPQPTDFDSIYSGKNSKEWDRNEILSKIRNNMMSVALKYVVDFIIRQGGLEFSCPRPNGTYPNPLDCRKYYVCDIQGNVTQKECEGDKTFSNETLSCIPNHSVALCNDIQILPEFNCSSTGLHVFSGDCSKFVICSREMTAYSAGCNQGDFFDQELLMCLPSTEVSGMTLASEMTFDKDFVGIRFTPYSKLLEDRRNYTLEEVESMLEVVSTRFTNIYISHMGTVEPKKFWMESEAIGYTPVAAANVNKRNDKLSLKLNIGCYGTVDEILEQEVENAFNAANKANEIYNGTVSHIAFHLNFDSEAETFFPNSTEPFLRMVKMNKDFPKYKLGIINYECEILEQPAENWLTELIGMLDYIICLHFPLPSITTNRSVQTDQKVLQNFRTNLLKLNPTVEIFATTGWPSEGLGAFKIQGSKQNVELYWSQMSKWAREARFKTYAYISFDEPWRDTDYGHFRHYGWWTRISSMHNGSGGKDYFIEKISREGKVDDDIREEIRFVNANTDTIPSILRNNTFLGVMFNLDSPSLLMGDVANYTLKVQEEMLELVAMRYHKIATMVAGTDSPKRSWDQGLPFGYTPMAAANVNKRKGSLSLELNVGCMPIFKTHLEADINNAIHASIEANQIFNQTVTRITVFVFLGNAVDPTQDPVPNLAKVFKLLKPVANQNRLKLGIRYSDCDDITKLPKDDDSNSNPKHKILLEMVGIADFVVCTDFYPQLISSELTWQRLGEKFLNQRERITSVYPQLEVIAETGLHRWHNQTRTNPIKELVGLWTHMGSWAYQNQFLIYMMDAFDQPWRTEGQRFSGWWKRSSNVSLCCNTFEEKIINLGKQPEKVIAPDSKLHLDTNYIGVQFAPYTQQKKFGDYTLEEIEQMLELVSTRFRKIYTIRMGIHGNNKTWDYGDGLAYTALAAANVNRRNGRQLLQVSLGCYGTDTEEMEQEFKYALDAARFANGVFRGTVSALNLLHLESTVDLDFLVKRLPTWRQLTKELNLQIGIRTGHCEDFANGLTSNPINTSIQVVINQLDFISCSFITTLPSSTAQGLIQQFGGALLNMRQTLRNANLKIKVYSDIDTVPNALKNSTNLWSVVVSWAKQNTFLVYLNGAFDQSWSKDKDGWWATRSNVDGDLEFVEKNDDVDKRLKSIETEILQLNAPTFDTTYFAVSFFPLTKFHILTWDYSINDVDNMLELVASKFHRVLTVASLPEVSRSQRKAIQVLQHAAIAASNINFRNEDLVLTLSLKVEYYPNITLMEQQIGSVVKVALIANNNHNGTVHQIIIELDAGDILNYTDLINQAYFKATPHNLQVGLMTPECNEIYNLRENPDIRQILLLISTIICSTSPLPSPSVKISAEKLQQDLLNWRASLNSVNSRLIVACSTGWPSKYANVNGTQGSVPALTEFWLNMNEWAGNNKFLTYMVQAFDQPALEIFAASNLSFSSLPSDAHYGWWIRTKNDTSLPEAFVEKFKRVRDNLEIANIAGTNWWIWTTLTVIIATSLLAVVTFYKYHKIKRSQVLSDAAIKEFELGIGSTSGIEVHKYGLFEAEDGLLVPYDRKFEILYSQIHSDFTCILGSGTFGIVYKGNVDSYPYDVALKMAKNNSSAQDLKSFLCDTKIMIHVGKHRNVVSLIGACTEKLRVGKVIMVTELCENGSLEKFLRSESSCDRCDYQYMPLGFLQNGEASGSKMYDGFGAGDNRLTTHKLSKWAFEIACGMEYISSRKVIHADLATRNVLLTGDETAKITDFGLSRRFYEYEDYVKKGQEPLPWRWMALESLQNMTFSTQSDVWSYGVTIWEIFTIGVIPYPGKHWGINFSTELKGGLRLNKPEFASASIYKIMTDCWSCDAKSRPSFAELREFWRTVLIEDSNLYFEL